MNITIVDGYTLNPGDLSWEELNRLGTVDVYDRSTNQELLQRCINSQVILTNKAPLSGETLDQLPKLQYIGVTATGYNIVDTEAASKRGIPVTNVPAYGSASVAQMTFAHILNLTQRVEYYSEAVDEGRWSNCHDFCFWDYPLIELKDKILGVLGYGSIGKEVAKIGKAFGMKILAYSPSLKIGTAPDSETTAVTIEDLLKGSDFVTLHCPLTKENAHIINATTLDLMKPTAFLINTSRGQLIDEMALSAALQDEKIAGAGLDVLSSEPPPPDNPLLHTKNCFITPHIAWATTDARARLLKVVIDNLKAFIRGNPQNVVNPDYSHQA